MRAAATSRTRNGKGRRDGRESRGWGVASPQLSLPVAVAAVFHPRRLCFRFGICHFLSSRYQQRRASPPQLAAHPFLAAPPPASALSHIKHSYPRHTPLIEASAAAMPTSPTSSSTSADQHCFAGGGGGDGDGGRAEPARFGYVRSIRSRATAPLPAPLIPRRPLPLTPPPPRRRVPA